MRKHYLALFVLYALTLSALSSPLQDILNFYEVRQEQIEDLWMQKGKERWEFDTRYESTRSDIWPLFEKAGLIFEKEPQKPHYNYALVHGALLSRVQARITYLSDLLKKGIQFDEIVFLTGERPLLESEQVICPASFESEMVAWVYSQSDIPKNIPSLLINAPKKQIFGSWTRPETRDTIASWLQTTPAPGTCLAISNQPYVGYQHAVIQSLLPTTFDLETAGPASPGPLSVAIILDTIAKELKFSH